MLRCSGAKRFDELHRLVEGVAQHDRANCSRSTSRATAAVGRVSKLPLDFAGDGLCQALRGGQQHGRRVDIVFRLGEHIGREMHAGSPSAATIRISVGPATKSMPTSPASSFFAAAT